MRSVIVALTFVFCLIIFDPTSNTHAALTIVDGHVYDDINDQYWVKNTLIFANQNWATQQQSVANYSATIDGILFSDWRIADTNDLVTLINTPYNTLFNIFDSTSGTVSGVFSSLHFINNRFQHSQGTLDPSVFMVENYDNWDDPFLSGCL